MKKKIVMIAVLALFFSNAFGQKYITKSGVCDIYSETPAFTIEGSNKKVASILDMSNGNIISSTLIRSFKFKEALVEEHFNENYLEPHKFPKSVFKGKIDNFAEIDLSKDTTYNIAISGKLTIHGVTQSIKEKGTVTVKAGNISASTVFNVSLAAHQVKVEKAYKHAIKDDIKLKIRFDYKPYGV